MNLSTGYTVLTYLGNIFQRGGKRLEKKLSLEENDAGGEGLCRRLSHRARYGNEPPRLHGSQGKMAASNMVTAREGGGVCKF